MRDAFGEVINVGDEVAFMLPSYSYRSLQRGVVVRITEKRVRVAYTEGGQAKKFLTCGPDVVVKPIRVPAPPGAERDERIAEMERAMGVRPITVQTKPRIGY